MVAVPAASRSGEQLRSPALADGQPTSQAAGHRVHRSSPGSGRDYPADTAGSFPSPPPSNPQAAGRVGQPPVPEVVYLAACRLTGSLSTSPSCSTAAEPYSGFPDGT